MATYAYNPTPAEASTLAQIVQRESHGDYSIFTQLPNSHASGAYQFQPGTWATAAAATGVGTQYANAGDAPAWMQDTNALWLLRNACSGDPNASMCWAATGPYEVGGGIPGASTQPVIDVSGSGATQSTADILSSLESSVTSVDLTNPITDIMLLAAAGAALFFLAR